MARRLSGSSLLLLLLASGCGRSLELPADPASGPDGPAPRFLGELSGTYDLGVRFPLEEGSPIAGLLLAGGGVLPIAGAAATLLHVPGPDGPPDDIAGYVAVQGDGVLHSCDPLQAFLDSGAPVLGSWDGEQLTAQQLSASGPAPRVSGRRAAGGAGLALDYSACGAGGPIELFASPSCSWDPALSGVYEGRAGSCELPSGGGMLGVGIRNGTFAATEWPSRRRVIFGLHHALDDGGVAARVDLDAGLQELGAFTLTEHDGELELDLRFHEVAAGACPTPTGLLESLQCFDCLREEACASFPDGGPEGACGWTTAPPSCEDRFVGTRETGTALGECELAQPKFTLTARLDGVRAGGLVDVILEKIDRGSWTPVTPLTGFLERPFLAGVLVADDGTILQNLGPLDARGSAGHPVSLTFDVGAGGAGRSYTLVAAALGACVPGAVACAAMPVCLSL